MTSSVGEATQRGQVGVCPRPGRDVSPARSHDILPPSGGCPPLDTDSTSTWRELLEVASRYWGASYAFTTTDPRVARGSGAHP